MQVDRDKRRYILIATGEQGCVGLGKKFPLHATRPSAKPAELLEEFLTVQ